MDKFFSISETAHLVGLTSETLRHYDRIGLVKPSYTDLKTGYRFYSQQKIVELNTIKALRCMDFSLSKIKEILAYDDFSKIVSSLKEAGRSADEKIAELTYSKEKINRALRYYEEKIDGQSTSDGVFVKSYPQRVILLSNTLETPSLDNLWNYHKHFFNQIPEEKKDLFSFEDLAGIYEENGRSQLFAICTRHTNIEGIRVLKKGRYLCSDCTEDNRFEIIDALKKKAMDVYGVVPGAAIQLVVLSGILQWNYQVQIFIG